MISVSGRQVLNSSSTRANHSKHASTAAGSTSSRTSMLHTVPHTSWARRTGREFTVAIVRSDAGAVERALQRLRVALARVRRARHAVDLRALGLQRLLAEQWTGLFADVLRARPVARELDSLHVGDLASLQRDAHLHRSVLVL